MADIELHNEDVEDFDDDEVGDSEFVDVSLNGVLTVLVFNWCRKIFCIYIPFFAVLIDVIQMSDNMTIRNAM